MSFEGRIDDPQMPSPRVWIVRFPEVEQFKRRYPRGRIDVSRAALIAHGARYENAWHLIEGRDPLAAAESRPERVIEEAP